MVNLEEALLTSADARALIATLEALGDDERAAWDVEARKSMPRLRRVAGERDMPELAVIVAAFFEVPVKRAALALADGYIIPELDECQIMDQVAQHLARRGPEWASALVAAACERKQADQFRPLLDALIDAHGLPLPDDPRYWTSRFPVPGPELVLPGRRFWDRLAKAAAITDSFAGWISPEHFDKLAGPVARLRAAEPVPHSVLPALVQVFTRGDRPAAQQYALNWIDLLGLRGELWQHRTALRDALPLAPAKVAGVIVEQLLRPELSDEELTALAVVALVRKEKGIRRSLLKALPRLAEPDEELRELVAVLTTDGDTTTRDLAAGLLQSWGEVSSSQEEQEPTGLWREPALTGPEPMPAFSDEALRLDAAQVADLLGDDINTSGFFPQLVEWSLAVLVAHARDHGTDRVRELVRRHLTAEYDPFAIRALLLAWADGAELKEATVAPAVEGWSPLPMLAARRIVEVLGWLGELPCLLSTPSHQGFRVSWEEFAARVGRYQEVGQPLLAADVAVALARLDRAAAPADLSPFAHPIHGVAASLDEVLAHWRDTDPEPISVSFAPALKDDITAQWHYRMVFDGDAPVTLAMLRLADLHSSPGGRGLLTAKAHIHPCFGEPFTIPVDEEVPAVAQLLPQHQAHQALAAVHPLERHGVKQAAWCHQLLGDVANPFSEALTVLGLAWAGGAAPEHRDAIAELWLRAWDEGRLTAEDLVTAWHSVLFELPDQLGHTARHFRRAPAKVAEVLAVIADGGGLALVWPLLAVLAEEAAGADKVPATTAGLLETVLRLLPEVQAAGVSITLPNVAALAASKGKTKTITVARQIAEAL
ncbi:MAG: DUF6493 family protein [Propionibacteriaceae bacterium]|nr:DUF6493 family protein [Propionibacteriaceae bacterium]